MNEEQNAVRIDEVQARALLARASELDAMRGHSLSVAQLRDVAREAGIASDAFDAALAEQSIPRLGTDASPLPSTEQGSWRRAADWWRSGGRAVVTRNVLGLIVGGAVASVAHGTAQAVSSSWLAEKAADALAMVIVAASAHRLGARRLAVVAAGFAISQSAEFVLDVLNGAPAVHGRDPHLALMAVGVAIAALLNQRLRRPPAVVMTERGVTHPMRHALRLVREWFEDARASLGALSEA